MGETGSSIQTPIVFLANRQPRERVLPLAKTTFAPGCEEGRTMLVINDEEDFLKVESDGAMLREHSPDGAQQTSAFKPNI